MLMGEATVLVTTMHKPLGAMGASSNVIIGMIRHPLELKPKPTTRLLWLPAGVNSLPIPQVEVESMGVRIVSCCSQGLSPLAANGTECD